MSSKTIKGPGLSGLKGADRVPPREAVMEDGGTRLTNKAGRGSNAPTN